MTDQHGRGAAGDDFAGGGVRPPGPEGSDPARLAPGSSDPGAGIARRTLTVGVPLWALLVTAAIVAGGFGVAMIAQARSATHLGHAVAAAKRVEVHLTLCNRDVDRLGINPRTSELSLEKALRESGAVEADVVVERIDCPQPRP
ncbi:MAG: hypothetical protein ACR2GF_00205 [Acidimicrobiales bacterium]